MNASEMLSTLNDKQLDAVKHIDGFVNLAAGAGSGKSRVIVVRTAYMIDQGIDPSSILVVTFTKAAALEVKRRISEALGQQVGKQVNAMNFHSFCLMVLNSNAICVDFESPITAMPTSDQEALFNICKADFYNRIGEDFGFDDRELKDRLRAFPTTKALLHVYSDWRNSIHQSLSSFVDDLYEANPSYDVRFSDYAHDLILDFVKRKKERNAMDFDDLLFYTVKLFEASEGVRAKIDSQYKYIMCDEYQDTNLLQDRILDMMTQDYKNLFVVGDRNQSIYGFRGAEVGNIISFAKRHPGTAELDLPLNYRSSNEILDTANAVINHAHYDADAHMYGTFDGLRPCVVEVNDDDAEANWIVADILNRRFSQHVSLDKMAVLFRNGNLTSRLEMVLNKLGIPFEKRGGTSFFERKHIVDILSLLKMSLSIRNDLAWYRGLSFIRGVGDRRARSLYEDVLDHGVDVLIKPVGSIRSNLQATADMRLLYDLLKDCERSSAQYAVNACMKFYQVYRKYQIEGRRSIEAQLNDERSLREEISDIEDLSYIAEDYDSIEAFLNDCALSASARDMVDDDGEKLVISTIHSAKGLEWDMVYIVGAFASIFPSDRFSNSDDDIDEERRCMYVAITRAAKELYFLLPATSTRLAMSNHFKEAPQLSPFLNNHHDVMQTLDTVVCNNVHTVTVSFSQLVAKYD